MKHRLPLGACLLAALALVAFGLVYGTLRGYADERREVEALWEEANGLRDVLSYRAADGLNPVSYTHLDVYKRQRLSTTAATATLPT